MDYYNKVQWCRFVPSFQILQACSFIAHKSDCIQHTSISLNAYLPSNKNFKIVRFIKDTTNVLVRNNGHISELLLYVTLKRLKNSSSKNSSIEPPDVFASFSMKRLKSDSSLFMVEARLRFEIDEEFYMILTKYRK